MNTFMYFLLFSFFAGTYFWDKKPLKRILFFIGLCAMLAFAYYQINSVI